MAEVNMQTNTTPKVPTYPGNQKKPEKKRQEKIVKGKVTAKQQSLGKRFVNVFIGENVTDIKSYILFEVLVPGLKNTWMDIQEMLLFPGESRRRRSRGSGTYTPYASYYSSAAKSSVKDSKPSTGSYGRNSSAVQDIILDNLGDAEEVIGNLVEIIDEYGFASVADLYDMVGVSTTHVDEKWGWKELGSARPRHVRDGYLLDLPRVVALR